jgi:NAD-dependent SIR2 family protein deacetylase
MPISNSQLSALDAFIRAHPRLFVLTGAGVSTGSGIPGYRDNEARWQRKQPVTHQEFLRSDAVRRRYWARSMAGWPVISNATPNAAHLALARLERAGVVTQLVTQNVDGLHQRAGSARVIELHGNIHAVICMDCGANVRRAAVQAELEATNPAFANEPARIAPDGDADLEQDFDSFAVPACPSCGGMLKPDVVFFGANVPRSLAATAMDALQDADAVLAVGSSLMAYSGYRFCEQAHASGKPVAAVNIGRTRADDLLQLKVEDDCAMALNEAADQLGIE